METARADAADLEELRAAVRRFAPAEKAPLAGEGALRDARLYEIGAGTSEIRRKLIGRELLR